MVLRLAMITSVVFYAKKKKHYFYEKNLKLTTNNTLNDVYCSRIFPYYNFLPFFLNSFFKFFTNLVFLIPKMT